MTDPYTELRKAIEKAQAVFFAYHPSLATWDVAPMARLDPNTIRALLEERDRLAKDAARYRVIRNVKGSFEVSMHGAMFWNEGLDAVVDAAMLPQPPAIGGANE